MKRDEELTHLARRRDGSRDPAGRQAASGARSTSAQDFVHSAPSNENILGQIIAIVDGVYVAGKYQVVAHQPRQEARPRAGQRARRLLSRRRDARSLRPPGLVGLHGELRQGAAAGRAQRHDPACSQVYDRMSYALVVESSQVDPHAATSSRTRRTAIATRGTRRLVHADTNAGPPQVVRTSRGQICKEPAGHHCPVGFLLMDDPIALADPGARARPARGAAGRTGLRRTATSPRC